MNFRRFVARVLEADHGRDRHSRAIDIFLMLLILANVFAIILESEPALGMLYHRQFFYFEVFSVTVFTLEYVLRLWSCPDIAGAQYGDGWRGRLRYAVTPMAMIDLLAIAPFYFSLLFVVDLRFLRVIRLLRVFKLTRYSPALQVMLSVLRKESPTLVAAVFILLILLVLGSSGIYLIEHEVQPEVFGSIPKAMWWTTVTLTTVGYGDVVPITALGKFFAGFIAIVGVGMVALPTAILASGFSEEVRLRRDQYSVFVKEALSDGVITSNEKLALERVRRQLGVSEMDAHMLQLMQENKQALICPHCKRNMLSGHDDADETPPCDP